MHTTKIFSEEQKKKLKKMGFESFTENTWYKKYGSDDSVNTKNDGFSLILNPLNAKGTVRIGYCAEYLDEIIQEDDIIDDTCDVINIFNDIANLKEEQLIF